MTVRNIGDDRSTMERRVGLRRANRRPAPSRGRSVAGLLVVALLSSALTVLSVAAPAAAAPCDATGNPIACENTKPGSPASEWDISGSGDSSIQGFATDISVNVGSSVAFKVKTDARAYRVDVYRLGWYGGSGARKMATLSPSATLPQNQPACVTNTATFLFDCGRWGVSASWTVPTTAVSGVYIAKLTRTDTGGASHIPFVVRDDASRSAVLFQTSDTTWQAYNRYGGANMYPTAGGMASKVSYNRPFATRDDNAGQDYLFANEYPMIRFLERNGYDVSYFSGVDTDRRGALIKNHQTFLSVGHDEYWSGAQRANVEAARDAGVNLAFFSGNEVYWKTRWESSVDGAGTPFRTLVTYKETHSNAKVDPDPAWTGTWRDPRFSTDSRPENALTGTAYMVNSVDAAITVPAAFGKTRLWRSTSVASLAAGSVATLAPHTLGYESNEDLDNGFRPKGLVRLSETKAPVPQYLQDFGTNVLPGTTTHHLTMYRHTSGALVFSAGTIQWPWGLDTYHDGDVQPVDVRMQQATMNLLADMGAQPVTRMAGLVAATKSTDTTAPTAAVTLPAQGTTLTNGQRVTVSGTAADTGGGVVAGIEVSLNGGATWHPATGTSSWSYTGTVHGSGTVVLQARATDDSGNTQATPGNRSYTTSCPCTLFGFEVPTVPSTTDTTPVEVGTRFVPSTAGWVRGVRFYKGPANTGTHTGSLWGADGARLATGTFTGETATGWQTLEFAAPVRVRAGSTYISSYWAPNGRYAADSRYFAYRGRTSPPLTAPGGFSSPNGVFRVGPGFPTSSFEGANYWVDPLFGDVDTFPPAVVSTVPLAGAASVPTTTPVEATFSDPITQSSLQMTLEGPGGTQVAGQLSYDATTLTARLVPGSALARGQTYTVRVRAADTAGNLMPSATAFTFRTMQAPAEPGVCPCRVWDDTVVPSVVSAADVNPVQLGTAFAVDVPGTVTQLHFYKGPSNTGTHTGALWTTAGQLVAQGTFVGEASSGWQTLTFALPVAVSAGTTYIASYRAPVGAYSYDSGYFAEPRLSGPIRALGGRYTYGGGAPLTGSTSNYWVDVSFVPTDLPPSVASAQPADGATSVAPGTDVRVTFSEAVTPASVTLELRRPDGSQVPGVVTFDAPSRTARFVPSTPLPRDTVQTVRASATDLGGKAMSPPYGGTFRTAAADDVVGLCPCGFFSDGAVPGTVQAADPGSVELGVAFTAAQAGRVTGIQFYKASGNTGTHTGSVWSASGQLLAQGTFGPESATGWQTLVLATPVELVPGTTYVASYRAPVGRYSFTADGLSSPVVRGPLTAVQGRYTYGSGAPTTGSTAFYGVDVVFEPTSGPLVVSSSSPVAGSVGVDPGVVPSVSFSEPVDPASVEFSVRDAAGALLPGVVAVDATKRSATFTPSAPLARGVVHEARVRASKPGQPLVPVFSFSFTTSRAPVVGAVGLFDASVVPEVADSGDRNSVEVGMRFRSDVAGEVVGVQFYKGPANPGPRSVSLWSADGQLLARATGSETASGWQTVTFDAPVAVQAGAVFTVSYRAPQGGYSFTGGVFALPVTVGRLTGVGGAYTYGSGAPVDGTSTSFLVDVEFVPSLVVSSSSPVAGSVGVDPGVVPSVSFSEPVDPASVEFSVRDAAGALLPGVVAVDATKRSATFTPSAPLARGVVHEARVRASKPGQPLVPVFSFSFTTSRAPVVGAVGLFDASVVPEVADSGDRNSVEVGMRFRSDVAGEVVGVQFYKGPANPGPRSVSLWSADGQLLARATGSETASGWQTVTFDAPVAVQAGAVFTVSYRAPQGGYSFTGGVFALPVTVGRLTGVGGAYTYGSGAPVDGTSTSFLVDVEFVPSTP